MRQPQAKAQAGGAARLAHLPLSPCMGTGSQRVAVSCYGCRSATAPNYAPADARSSSGAGVSGSATETRAFSRKRDSDLDGGRQRSASGPSRSAWCNITALRARSPTSSPVSRYPISAPVSIGTRGSSGDPQTVASEKRFSRRSTSALGSLSTDAARAGAGRITLAVAGLDALLERLAAQRIEHEPIETYSNGVRHVNVPDPDGSAIAFAEPPDAASASPSSTVPGASS
jgi:hypothetical protein